MCFSPPLQGEGWVGMVLVLRFGFGVVARTDPRPCVVRRPSLVAGYFLLLAQKKVTKEKGTLGAAPLAARAVRYGRTGSAKRPSMASRPNRRDPSRRPRAGHAAFPSALRRGFRGDPEEQKQSKKPKQMDSGFRRNDDRGRLCAASRRRLGVAAKFPKAGIETAETESLGSAVRQP